MCMGRFIFSSKGLSSSVTIAAYPAEGWEFKGWSDGNNDQVRQFTILSDMTLIAYFELIGGGVEAVSGQQSDISRKVLIEGHVYILTPDGRMFDSTGREVK